MHLLPHSSISLRYAAFQWRVFDSHNAAPLPKGFRQNYLPKYARANRHTVLPPFEQLEQISFRDHFISFGRKTATRFFFPRDTLKVDRKRRSDFIEQRFFVFKIRIDQSDRNMRTRSDILHFCTSEIFFIKDVEPCSENAIVDFFFQHLRHKLARQYRIYIHYYTVFFFCQRHAHLPPHVYRTRTFCTYTVLDLKIDILRINHFSF